jgi:preprotein translocase subunit SecE
MAANTKLKKSNAEKEDEPSPYSPTQIKKFVGEVKAEFLKIVWPNKKTTLGLAGIVIALTSVMAIYLGTVDLILGKLVGMLIR